MDRGLLLFAAGLLGFWTVVYALGRGRKGKFEVYPGALLVRAGISLEPMGDGPARRAVLAFGYVSVVLLAASAALFYYYAFYLFLLRYIKPPPGGAPAGFSPLIPGVTIGWVDAVYIFLAVGIAALVHELAHAYVSRAVGVRVKDAGIAFFLFIPAAFVEPDEEAMKRAPLRSRIPIYSAGVGANIVLALVLLGLLASIAGSLTIGVRIARVEPGSPASQAGLEPGMVIIAVNGEPVRTVDDLIEKFHELGIGEASKNVTVNLTVLLPGGGEKVVSVTKPRGAEKIGVYLVQEFRHRWLVTFAKAGYIINLSLALINAAPLAIPLPGGVLFADGGQIVRDMASRLLGEKKGDILAYLVGVGTFVLVLSLMSLQKITL